jgi:hypothetical protein
MPDSYGPVAPWSLGHVCRRWRAVALSAPRLWRTIDISLRYENPRTLSSLLQLVTIFVERSGTCPFALRISSYNQIDFSPLAVLDLLMRESPRWERLELDLKIATAMPWDFPRVKGNIQSLHTFIIRPYTEWNPPYAGVVFRCVRRSTLPSKICGRPRHHLGRGSMGTTDFLPLPIQYQYLVDAAGGASPDNEPRAL